MKFAEIKQNIEKSLEELTPVVIETSTKLTPVGQFVTRLTEPYCKHEGE
jgi:hypothetical protein